MPQLLLNGLPIGTIKGVLFDKDGTLSYSEAHLLALAKERIKQSTLKFLGTATSNKEVLKLQRLLSTAYGITPEGLHPGGTIAVASRNQNLISTATIFCLLGEAWPQAFSLANEVFNNADLIGTQKNHGSIKQTLLPGALKVLKSLKQAGVTCALISNDTSKGIQNFLNFHQLENLLPNFWSAEHLPAKPDPGAIEGICTLMGLLPSDCALIGDADSDLQMARKAGVRITLAYISGWKVRPTLKEKHQCIQHWNEVSVEANLKVPDRIV